MNCSRAIVAPAPAIPEATWIHTKPTTCPSASLHCKQRRSHAFAQRSGPPHAVMARQRAPARFLLNVTCCAGVARSQTGPQDRW
eukprot:14341523-Heterocapsa_arctica.AAC.1